MTIEHARTNARLPEFSYQEIATPLQGGRVRPGIYFVPCLARRRSGRQNMLVVKTLTFL